LAWKVSLFEEEQHYRQHTADLAYPKKWTSIIYEFPCWLFWYLLSVQKFHGKYL